MEALNATAISVFASFSTPPSPRNPSRPSFFTNFRKSTSSAPNSNSLKSCSNCTPHPPTPAPPPFQSIRNLASRRKWNPRPGGPSELDGEVLQSGGVGMALLSTTTAAARVHISPFIATLAANPTFVSGLLAWALAQTMKVFLNFFLERKWDLRILFSSGGMPSSHSALCTALTTSVAICHGVRDSLFPVCLGFSLIVMYDATGVRRHAGMQAEVLNMIIEDLFQWHPISQRKLKELLGHTPSQVFAGALLGILVACFCCQGCLVAA